MFKFFISIFKRKSRNLDVFNCQCCRIDEISILLSENSDLSNAYFNQQYGKDIYYHQLTHQLSIESSSGRYYFDLLISNAALSYLHLSNYNSNLFHVSFSNGKLILNINSESGKMTLPINSFYLSK